MCQSIERVKTVSVIVVFTLSLCRGGNPTAMAILACFLSECLASAATGDRSLTAQELGQKRNVGTDSKLSALNLRDSSKRLHANFKFIFILKPKKKIINKSITYQ